MNCGRIWYYLVISLESGLIDWGWIDNITLIFYRVKIWKDRRINICWKWQWQWMCMRLWGAGPEERQWPSLLAEDTSSANNKAISILLFNIHAASYQFNQSKKDYLYLTLVLLFEFFVPSFVFCDCIICVRYFLDKIDISLPGPGYPASSFDRLFEFFSLCLMSVFFYVFSIC